jgi:hypothetical protein
MKSIEKVLVASLVMALLVVLLSEWNRGERNLPKAHWQDMAKLLKNYAQDDTILLHNGGSTEGLDVLQAAGLEVRLALPEPRGRIRRLWVVGTHRFLEQGLGELAANELPKQSIPPGLYLKHFVRSAGSILWHASDELRSAQIRVAGKRCQQPKDGGVRCAHLPDWMYVAPTQLKRSGRTHHCLWAHPPSGGRPLIIRYETIPKGELHFEHGLSDTAAGSSNTHPVKVELKWAGGQATVKATNQSGWKKSQHTVDGFLEISVRAAQDGQRHHCFKAVIQ